MRSTLNKKALGSVVVGIVFIVLLGSALHFAFEWSGYWAPVALFAAVNESTWEHFKIAFWPGLLFAVIEYPRLRGSVRTFWGAKALGLLTMPIVIALLYAYTAVLGYHNLILDIVIFVVAVAAGHLVSYKVMTSAEIDAAVSRALSVLLAVMVLVYSLLSFFAPSWFLFEDPETGQYGILNEYGDHDQDHEQAAAKRSAPGPIAGGAGY